MYINSTSTELDYPTELERAIEFTLFLGMLCCMVYVLMNLKNKEEESVTQTQDEKMRNRFIGLVSVIKNRKRMSISF